MFAVSARFICTKSMQKRYIKAHLKRFHKCIRLKMKSFKRVDESFPEDRSMQFIRVVNVKNSAHK